MLCPSCNKFAAYSTDAEPEFDMEASPDGTSLMITGTCRICLTSECCGDELKEAQFDIEHEFGMDDLAAACKEAGVECPKGFDACEWDDPATDSPSIDERKIKGKRCFGVETEINTDTTIAGKTVSLLFNYSEFISVGEMDELV